tara:strand:- start:14857 stop:15687 length:831 start_codon:yes stop_codon:yes gene_type:complete
LKNRINIYFPVLLICFGCDDSEQLEGNKEREYILYKPESLQKNAPLVFVLHGYTSSAETIQLYSQMNKIADEHEFAVCYPKGTKDNNGISHWNAQLTISDTDDIKFLSELAQTLQDIHSLDPERTFVCGMSNGGFMSYTLACEAPEIFKAIASVTGTMSGRTWENCDPSIAVPIFQISGVEDEVVPIDGSMNIFGGWGGAPSMDEVINFWVNQNNCTSTDTVFFSENTEAYYNKNCVGANEVWYYKINNWGHEWPTEKSETGTVASKAIWEFFSKF